jgi:hypothetical protein
MPAGAVLAMLVTYDRANTVTILAIPLLLTVQTRMDNYPGRFGSPVMLDVKFERYLPSKAGLIKCRLSASGATASPYPRNLRIADGVRAN